MTGVIRLSPIERAAKSELESKGYAVMPMIPCFATRYKPVHLMAERNATELLYLKLKEIVRPQTDIMAIRQFCYNDAMLLRRLFPLNGGWITLHLEIWIRDTTGRFTCFEVLAEEIREVSHV
ncbi:MAG: hypothetical protein Q7T80_17820 [Methanoregula sp.]|nr:hypothetical protein [Methanoregula sp.]